MTYLNPTVGSWLFFGIFLLIALVVSLCKESKQGDEAIQRNREQGDPFGVATHDPEPPVECLSDSFRVPAFIRHQEEELPRPRTERE